MRHYLLVDDNEAFAENLAEILRDRGDEVTIANSGAGAVELARGRAYDALLTDMRMPFMDGTQLVHAIRQVDPGLPALVVTAYIGDEALASARHEGLLAALPKPVPVEGLLLLLGRARRDGLVAIVEDDEALADNLTEALRDHGFSAVTAGSVLQTEGLRGLRPTCALVDLRVPGGPSGEALRRLRATFPGLPVLVITAFVDEPLTHADFKVHLKPFDTGALMRDVERLWRERLS
jgi:CheY-like chemotaxis protein